MRREPGLEGNEFTHCGDTTAATAAAATCGPAECHFFSFFLVVDLGSGPPARAASASVDNMQNCIKVSRKQIQFVRPGVIIMHEGLGEAQRGGGGLTKSLCSTRSKPSKEES